jgi:hypothetical protein
MFGIDRSSYWQDTRPPEVKAAMDKITIGYLAGDIDHAVFRCSECGSCGVTPSFIEHTMECSVGKVLVAWESTLPYWMRTTKRV